MISALVALTGLVVSPGMPLSIQTRSSMNVAMLERDITKIPTKNVWVSFAEARDCKPGTVVSGFKYGQEIAIVTTRSGKLYALTNKLPPTSQPATFGRLLEGDLIEDPISQTKFSLKSGKIEGTWCPAPALIGPAIFSKIFPKQGITTYQVRKQGNAVQVLVDVNAKAKFESSYWRGVLDSQGKVDGGYY